MTVVKWAMYLTPLAVFGLTAQLLAQLGIASLGALGAYAGTVLAGLILLMLLYFLLVVLFGKIGPLAFQRAIGEAQLLAFSTSSSAAVMPLSIRTAVEKLDVRPPIASFLIPLAATVNMAGTALYQAVAVVFVAQVGGVDLAPNQIAIIVITLVTASIGAPGTPGVSIAILSGLVASFGIPPQGLVLVLGIDRLLDMSRTAVNVTGDLVAARLFGHAKADSQS
jgi:Na+/H+-dicarboxylate symporter